MDSILALRSPTSRRPKKRDLDLRENVYNLVMSFSSQLAFQKAVVIMSPADSLERILKEIGNTEYISDVTLVSRSGMHIAGEVPKKAHRETYVAMSAILLGSAETATSELEDRLKYVLVELENTRILIQDSGSSAILVTRLEDGGKVEDILEATKKSINEIRGSL